MKTNNEHFQLIHAVQIDDIRRLLSTNNGEYAAACSLDFAKPPNVYDTFALRDSKGQQLLTQDWPYFRSSESRNAVIYRMPVPVSSCWNGISEKCFMGDHGMTS